MVPAMCSRHALAFALTLLGTFAWAEEEGYQQGRAGFGAWGIPVPLSVQAELGLQPGEGMFVLRVRAGGTAQSLGIQPGNVVTAINGTPISRHRDIRNYMSTVAPGDSAKVTVVDRNAVATVKDGEFKERRPRRFVNWGGMPNAAWRNDWRQDMFLSPDALIARQYAELFAEQSTLDQLETTLAALRAQMPDGSGNWVAHLDVRFP